MRERRGSAQFFILLIVAGFLLWKMFATPSLGRVVSDTVTDLAPGKPESRIETIAHGNEVTLESHLFRGKITIFDFYSDGCPPCVMFKPILHQIVEKDPTLALRIVDLNRKGQPGIDWSSPVAKQHKIQSIPYLVLYDGFGEEIARGKTASEMLINYANERRAANYQ